jgi:hypothetical protein
MNARMWIAGLALVALAGCQKMDEGFAARGPALGAPESKPVDQPPTAEDGQPVDGRLLRAEAVDPKQIIRNAELRLRTDDYAACRAIVVAAVARHAGYIASEHEENTDWVLRNTMVLRVPADRLDALLADLVSKAAFVEARNITAEDVTEQFVDMQARLKTKREVEDSYRRLLERAAKVEEILAIEKELRAVREEIEAVEGRLKYLSSQVAFSTVSLSFYQDRQRLADPGQGLGRQLWTGVVTGLEWMAAFLVGLVYVWPFLLVSGLAIWWVRRAGRKRRAKA